MLSAAVHGPPPSTCWQRGAQDAISRGGHTALCQPVPPGTAKRAGTHHHKCPHEVPTVPCRTAPPQPWGPMGGRGTDPTPGPRCGCRHGEGTWGRLPKAPPACSQPPAPMGPPPSCSRSALPPPGVHRPGRAAPRPAVRGPAGPPGHEAVAQVTSPGWDGDAGTRGGGRSGWQLPLLLPRLRKIWGLPWAEDTFELSRKQEQLQVGASSAGGGSEDPAPSSFHRVSMGSSVLEHPRAPCNLPSPPLNPSSPLFSLLHQL